MCAGLGISPGILLLCAAAAASSPPRPGEQRSGLFLVRQNGRSGYVNGAAR